MVVEAKTEITNMVEGTKSCFERDLYILLEFAAAKVWMDKVFIIFILGRVDLILKVRLCSF